MISTTRAILPCRIDKAAADDYRQLTQRAGIARQVVVQPAYGTDNRLLLDRLSTFGAQRVVVATPDTGDAELAYRDALGGRGLRLGFAPPTSIAQAMIAPLARRIEPLRLHVEANLWARDLFAMMGLLEGLPTRVMLDHFAHIPEAEGASETLPGVRPRKRKTRVKLSAPYDATKIGPPPMPIRVRLRARMSSRVCQSHATAPRLGTNWPHPSKTRNPTMRSCATCCSTGHPDVMVHHRILVENRTRLHGFPPIA